MHESAEPLGRRAYTPKHLTERLLRSRAALEGEHKQVTVLFADVKGSMQLAERLGAEAWHGVLDRFFQILADGVHRFEGTVNQYTGDGIMALFGAPTAHEDHAERACYAALWLREALRSYAQELRREHGVDLAVRVGLNSGAVVVGRIGDDLRRDYTAQGHTVGLAQRMEALAEAGKIYLAEATARLVRDFFVLEDLGLFTLHNVTRSLRVYALERPGPVHTRFERSRARGLSRFVGREREMDLLASRLPGVAPNQGQVVSVVAPPGTGKSRLCFELVEECRQRGATVFEAYGLAHGAATPLRPVLDMFRRRFGITESDSESSAREKIAGALLLRDSSLIDSLPWIFSILGVPDAQSPAPPMDAEAAQQRSLESLVRIVASEAQRGACVVLLEDLQWFDEASERFVRTLVAAAPALQALVLANFRPEYRSPWLGSAVVQLIELEPLSPLALRDLLGARLGSDAAVTDLGRRIAARSAGNPFFAEEMVQALIEDGSLQGTPSDFTLTRAVERIPLPDSVETLLAGRIDRLPPHDKRILQIASVIGADFSRALLAAVCDDASDDIDESLAALCRAQLLVATAFYPEIIYGFRHPLTHEVAYASQLVTQRAKLHARVARQQESMPADRLDESAAAIAWHWQQADNPQRAARWHGRAAAWLKFRDARASMQHWRAVCVLLPERPEEVGEARLLTEASANVLSHLWAFGSAGDEARRVLQRGLSTAQFHGDLRAQVALHAAYADSCTTRGAIVESHEHLCLCVHLAQQVGDTAVYAAAAAKRAFVAGFLGDLATCESDLDVFLAQAQDDPSWGAEAIGFPIYPLVLAWKTHVSAQRGRYEESAELDRRARRLLAGCANPVLESLCALSLVCAGAIRGDLVDALELAQHSVATAESFGALNCELVARSTLARAHAVRAEWEAAVSGFEATLRSAEEHAVLLEVQAFDLAALAQAYIEIGDLEAARLTAERGLRAATQRGAQLQELENRMALARASARAGDAAQAEEQILLCEALVDATDARYLGRALIQMRSERVAT